MKPLGSERRQTLVLGQVERHPNRFCLAHLDRQRYFNWLLTVLELVLVSTLAATGEPSEVEPFRQALPEAEGSGALLLRLELVLILNADQSASITVIRPLRRTCQLGCFRLSSCSLLLFFLPELVADLRLVRLAPLLVYPLLLPAKLTPILL